MEVAGVYSLDLTSTDLSFYGMLWSEGLKYDLALAQLFFFCCLSLYPGILVDKSPSGTKMGKSTAKSTRAKKMYHPIKVAARSKPAPTCWYVVAAATSPLASVKKAPARHPTIVQQLAYVLGKLGVNLHVGIRVKKIRKNAILVLIAAMA